MHTELAGCVLKLLLCEARAAVLLVSWGACHCDGRIAAT